jgi:hypothetical protein
MGSQYSAAKRWQESVPVGMLDSYYREYLDLLQRNESAVHSRRAKAIEGATRKHSETPIRRCLRTKDAARYLGMSAWALRVEVNKGELPFISSGEHTSSWKFDVRDLDAWIDRHKIKF